MSKDKEAKAIDRAVIAQLVTEGLRKLDEVQMAEQVSELTNQKQHAHKVYVRLETGEVARFTLSSCSIRKTKPGE